MNMKKKLMPLLMFVMILTALFSGQASAKTTAKKLFTLKYKDSYKTISVPVYEYNTNGKITLNAKNGMRTITFSPGVKTASVSVTGKTSYYASKYKSIRYANKVTLTSQKTLTIKVTKKAGGSLSFKVTAKRPAKPAIKALTLSAGTSSAFKTGSGKLSVSLKASSGVDIRAFFIAKTTGGKQVYQSSTLTGKGGTYKFSWDGKAASKNKAGLKAGSYVPSGTYTITGYVRYKAGSKWLIVKKTVNCKITTEAAKTGSSSDETAKTVAGQTWNWKMYVTGDDTLDYLAETICQSVLKNGMSETERAKALYQWCMRFTYANGVNSAGGAWSKTADKIDISSAAAKAAIAAYGKTVDSLKASGKAAVNNDNTYFKGSSLQKFRLEVGTKMLTKQIGDCLCMALAYEILCRHAGIQAGIIENSKSSGQSGHHFWNAVCIGGKYYFCDVNQAIYNKAYTYFLRGKTFMNQSGLYNHYKNNSANMALVNKVVNADCPTR